MSYPDGSSASFEYGASGNVATATDPTGKVSRFTYNGRGQLLTSVNPAGGVTSIAYNDDGTQASVQYPAAGVVSLAYDDTKRLAKISEPDQTAYTIAYDNAGNIVKQTNGRGLEDSFTYDANNQRASASHAQSGGATAVYNQDLRMSAVTVPGIKTQTLDYDEAGRLKSIVAPTGDSVRLGFDAQNRLTAVTYCSGKGLSVGYDKEGRIASIADGGGRLWSVTTDKAGNVTRISSPLGRQYNYAYDAMGRLTTFTDAAGHATAYGRDAAGRLTSLTSAGGARGAAVRNDLGLPDALTDALGNIWRWTYDGAGRRTSSVDPLGRAVAYQRDVRGRTARVAFPDGSAQLSYDADGNLTRRLYSDGTAIDFAYDARNLPTEANGVALAYNGVNRVIRSNGIEVARDDGYHVSAITYGPGLTVTYQYDCNGLLTSLTDWAGGVTTFGYDDSRELISIQRPNGVTTRYTYDADGRLTGIVESLGDTLSSIALTRDAAGAVASAERNLPLAPNPAPGALPVSYDAAGQVAGTYDGLGRPLALSGRSYTWDLAGRLTAYSGGDGAASFGYDAYGMRISRSSGDATRTYAINYGLAHPAVSIARQGGADLRYYVYLPDGTLLYSIEAVDSRHSFFHFDEMGSTVFLTADDGSITDGYGITPYGEQVDHTGSSDNPFTFLGAHGVMQEGSTGLFYMGLRYYDSSTARFLTRAPGVELDFKAMNPYQYARSNPLAFIDPMGRGPLADRTANVAEGGEFAQLVLSLPEMFRPRERGNSRLLPPAFIRGLNDFAQGRDARKETRP